MQSSPESTDDDLAAASLPVSSVRQDFDDFYRAHYGRLVRLLLGMTGRFGVAEELAQEALLSAYRLWPRVHRLDRPDLWLRRVAVNRAVSAHRRVVAEIGALSRVRTPQVVDGPDASDDSLWSAVRKLPRRQAAALVLWAVEDLTLPEIGEVLGCSPETARTHLRRARDRLGSMLKEEVVGEP